MVLVGKSITYQDWESGDPGLWTPGLKMTTRYRGSEGQLLIHDKNEPWNGTSRLVICLHGHGGSAKQYRPMDYTGSGYGAMMLAHTGRYVCLSIDCGPDAAGAQWSNSDAMQAITDALAYARSLGVKAGTYALMGWSMGGLTLLNYCRRANQSELVGGWLWVPACDLRWVADQPTGYVPPDGTGAWSGNATWQSEVQTRYRPATTVTAAATIPGYFAAGGPPAPLAALQVADTTDFNDGWLYRAGYATTRPQANWKAAGSARTLAGTKLLYESKDNTHFYNVWTTVATSQAVAVNDIIDIPTGAADTADSYHAIDGFSPNNELASFAGVTGQYIFALSTDDTTLPPAQKDYFINNVGKPFVFRRHPKGEVTGGHTDLFRNFTAQDIIGQFDAMAW